MAKKITFNTPAGITLPTITLKELREKFESNALKEKRNRNVGSLKNSIVKDGMIMPLVLWIEGKYITDGAGRVKALEMLEYEGYQIDAIPYFPVTAANKKEAKKHTLLISSKYGEITEESAADFMQDMSEIDLGDISIGLNLEEIDVTPPGTPKKGKKGRDKGKTVMMHTCPKCGHEFN